MEDPEDSDDDEDIDDDDDDSGPTLPELTLDDEGYARLPSRLGISLRGQQELIRMIFHASYSKFDLGSYLIANSIPTTR